MAELPTKQLSLGKPVQFIQEVLAELKKVTWPTRQETVKLTGLVIVISALVGVYVGGLDFLFTNISAFLFKQ